MNHRPYRAFGIAWLVVIGALTWHHAAESVWPPIYDAYSYFAKAKFVWEAFAAHHFGLKHLLAVEPTFRPFATVLLSYPFGFTTDFRGFYFRSTFWPVALVCGAGYIASWTSEPSRSYLRWSASTACFLSTLSLFFYFELYAGGPPAISHWGLVDAFLTGVAALAMAAGVRSIRQRSMAWACLSTVVSLLAIFVKPSGVLVAALCGGILAIGWAWRIRENWRQPFRRTVLRRTAWVIAIDALVLGGAAWKAVHSAYLSTGNMMYGRAAIEVMRAEMQIDWRAQFDVARAGLGPFVLAWIPMMAVVWISVRLQRRQIGETMAWAIDDLLVLLGAVALVVGLWFWLYGSGGRTQVRYFAPFLYVAIICALPGLLAALDRAGPLLRVVVGLLMACTMINLVLLLLVPEPDLAWQEQSGVNVKSGTRPASILQAAALIESPHAVNATTIFVYSCIEGIPDAMFESVFGLHALQTPVPRFVVRRPVDWQRPTAIRVEEVLSSDYLLANPSIPPSTLALDVPSANVEKVVFNTWIDGLTRDDGVESLSREPESHVLRVVDRTLFRRSMEAFVAARHWRPVFLSENTATWWSATGLRARVSSDAVAHDAVDFGGLVRLEHVRLVPDGSAAVSFEAWIRTSPAMVGDDWVMLVHFIGDNGKSLANHDIALGRLDLAPADKPYRLLRLRLIPPAGAHRIALGFYRGEQSLMPAPGQPDVNGPKLLVDLPRAAS